MALVSELAHTMSGYLKPDDIRQVEAAYRVAESAHEGQFRKSGEPYITHPVAVAKILAEWQLDTQALMAALLHDTVEDTTTSKAEISSTFGKPVAELVDGVTKIDQIEFQTREEAQAENFRKMLLAMARDVRVILIKLADRLHNMRTLDAVPREKQLRVAKETLEIYAPIANRLGLNNVYYELEDLCFKYLHPTRFNVLAKAVKSARGNRREVIRKTQETIKARLAEAGVNAEVYGREKHLASIYRKMQEKNVTFAQVLDVYGFRVIVPDPAACYLALGALHSMYKPIPGKFKDYIALPKPNGYQSLHTKLIGPFGTPIEIQIRTQDMHRIAESGVASHWMYKAPDDSLSDIQQKTHQWLQSLLEIQSESRDSIEFLEHIKVDLFPDSVYVFTPKGKILSLPKGATALDFAYAVHTDVGDHCESARVNQEWVPTSTVLKNGDRVEITTSPEARPRPSWLAFVATGKARARIRHFLKSAHYQEAVDLGDRLLEHELIKLVHNPEEVLEEHWMRLLKSQGAHKTREEILAEIGLGKRLAAVVARRLLSLAEAPTPGGKAKPGTSITVRGSEGMAVQFCKTCRPIPGDPILGLIKKGTGVVVHTHECPSLPQFRSDPERWIDVEWDADPDKFFDVNLRLVTVNQRGVLAKVAAAIAGAESNINYVNFEERVSKKYTTTHYTIEVRNRAHLAEVMRALRKLPEVVRLYRATGDARAP